jgi:hypothetical protein
LTAFALAASGCGSGKHAAPKRARATTTSTTTAPTSTAAPAGPSALQGEAASAAAGDIPDNQVYVGFANARAGYTMRYPEGWAQAGAGARVVFRDKNNIVRVVVQPGTRPTLASVAKDMRGLRTRFPTLRAQVAKPIVIGGARAIKVVYSTQSAPNPVTGKRVTLGVDRYYLFRAGKVAVVDLGSPIRPVYVDNVDAYRLMIHSFRWR